MKKKLLACFLCAVMAVTMAVPAFAADDAGGSPPTWPDYGMANQHRDTAYCRLNVYISDLQWSSNFVTRLSKST